MMQARIRQAYLLAVVVVAMAVVIGGTAFAQTNLGTWKVNVEKSKYNPGPAPKSGTLTYEVAGAGVKVTVDGVAADGALTHYTFTGNYDGKDNPEVGNPNADTIALTRVNATTTKSVSKKGGKVTTTLTSVVSSDGKTLTITTTGTNAQGQKVDSLLVLDKQ
jgi:hypothetical protein